MSDTTIKPLPHQRATYASQVNEPSLLVRTAELRDDVTQLADRATSLHVDQQQSQLIYRTTQLAQSDPRDLLRELSERGFSWPTLAKLVGVTTAAIRKWRRDSPVTPENRRRLAGVVAFCEL